MCACVFLFFPCSSAPRFLPLYPDRNRPRACGIAQFLSRRAFVLCRVCVRLRCQHRLYHAINFACVRFEAMKSDRKSSTVQFRVSGCDEA